MHNAKYFGNFDFISCSLDSLKKKAAINTDQEGELSGKACEQGNKITFKNIYF